MNDGSLVANHSRQVQSDDTCSTGETQRFSNWAGSGASAGSFTCFENGDQGDYSSPNTGQKASFCKLADYNAHSSGDTPVKGRTTPAVEYYPTRTQIMDQKPAAGLPGDSNVWAPTYPNGQRIVTDAYGWTPGLQTLHQAEKRYDGGSVNTCDGCHQTDAWSWSTGGAGAQTQLQDLGDGYSVGEREDSWTVANVEGKNNDKIGDNSFPGGFAGLCPSGQNWVQRGNEWQCSGQPSWQQAVMLPDTLHVGDEGSIGMFIMPYNWKDRAPNGADDRGLNSWKQAVADFESKAVSQVSSSQNLKEVFVTCYPSDSFSLDLNENMVPQNGGAEEGVDYFRKIVQIDRSRDKPLPVIGQVALKKNTTYNCKWRYETEGGESIQNVGTTIPLQKSGEVGGVDVSSARQYFTEGKGSDSFGGFPNLKDSYAIGELEECANAMNQGTTC